jgi:hypothetical protein
MSNTNDTPAQTAKHLGDLLAELADAMRFAVQHLSDDDHSVLPLVHRVMLQAIETCEYLRACIAEADSAGVQTPAHLPVTPSTPIALEPHTP